MSKISAEELAKQLNGFEVDDSFTKSVINSAKYSNLVIVSAIGDDTIILIYFTADRYSWLKKEMSSSLILSSVLINQER
jgi:hypothetical protein